MEAIDGSNGSPAETTDVEAVPTGKRAVLYLRVSTARQATKGGEAEGYSIPAQREVCRRKADDLGAVVVDEYVDAGASARSADRPLLQALLERLAQQRDVDYVIVHKVDRLARDRADDVAIGLAIHQAGAVLVSATEQIDDTPAGTLLHGIMATIAEFYSKNLSHEVKKGLQEKAKRGGTPGYAPLGYRNTIIEIDGRPVRTVAFDPERAEHMRWAFLSYATGDWSITELTEELDRRGMRSRTTAKFVGTPLTRSQVHRILGSPYYIGKIVYGGVEYEGQHEALIDSETWHEVQAVLEGRRLSGDRAWRHAHYLKGSVFCALCDSRLGFGYSRGKTGIAYPYFFCLGRHRKRNDCQLPYLGSEKVESYLSSAWQSFRFSSGLIAAVRQAVTQELGDATAQDEVTLVAQRRRLGRLEAKRTKLLDAYMAEAISVTELKIRRAALDGEQQEAERLIALAGANHHLAGVSGLAV